MIDFEQQTRKFLSITQKVKISANAQCLYFQLLYQFRIKFFPKELSLDNMSIHNSTNLSRQQITNARQELQKLALIKYKNGSGSASGKYTMIDITNAKVDSIVEISRQTAPYDALKQLQDELGSLTGEYYVWANYILKVLDNAIKENLEGVYSNYYTTSQTFLQAENNLKIDTVTKLITVLKNKPDIQNKEAYILTTIANTIKQQKQALNSL